MSSNGIVVGKTEFVFAKNDSGSFFFDTVNVNSNETKEKDTGIGNTFGTLDVPSGAVEDEVKFQVYSLGEQELNNGTDDNTTIVDPEIVKPPKVKKCKNDVRIKQEHILNYCLVQPNLKGAQTFGRKTFRIPRKKIFQICRKKEYVWMLKKSPHHLDYSQATNCLQFQFDSL